MPHPTTSVSPYQLTSSSSSQPAYVSPYAPTNVSPYAPTNVSPYAPTNVSPYAPTNVSPYAPTNVSPYAPTNVSPYAPTNVSPYQPVNTAQGEHPAPGAEPANTSQQDSGSAPTKRHYKKAQNNLPRLAWDNQADAFALAGHHAGKTIYEIRSQLGGHSYKASLQEVTESLRRQGVEKTNQRPKLAGTWDSQADKFSLEAYHRGQTPLQIATQLCKNGYEAAGAMVVESLGRQGVTAQLDLPALPTTGRTTQPATSAWDYHADVTARNAHLQGQTVSQIATQLCRSGYAATNILVAASLNRQGFNV